ncbi:MAG TPA: VOC family protein [Acidimicrobiales bacterium]|nr:VOC family protein [Acidimicrobiales bacterium]
MTAVTLGARSVAALRAFYRAIEWRENDGSDDTFTSFTMGSVRLALYPIELLQNEAAPDDAPVRFGSWNGMTLALNVATRAEVDDAVASAVAAGARPIGLPVEREWGGYSGYFADPEGHRWEIAWAPWLGDFE